MFPKVFSVIIVLIFAAFVGAQEPTREQRIDELRKMSAAVDEMAGKLTRLETRRDDLAGWILAVENADVTEAQKAGAEAIRVFPHGVLNGLLPEYPYGESGRSLCLFSHGGGIYSDTAIEYRNDSLQFNGESDGYGFIANLGGTLLGTVDEQTREAAALAKFEVPQDLEKVPNEFSFGGQTFRNKAPIIVGSTYLVRAFTTRGADGMFAFKIQRMDSDRSLVLFVRPVVNLSANGSDIAKQRSSSIPDYAVEQEVANALVERGYFDLTVEGTTTEITIRGTVPKGNMAEVMEIVQQIAKRKVNNQVVER